MNTVDLGLSVLWGDCNLGADTPEDQGGFYTWNEAVKKVNDQDLAGQMLGKGWRLPTYKEVEELLCNKLRPVFFPGIGLQGLEVYGKNGNSIFLPSNSKGLNVIVPRDANYWSSSLDDDDSNMASQFRFDLNGVHGGCNKKDYGQLIRPVFDKHLFDELNKQSGFFSKLKQLFK